MKILNLTEINAIMFIVQNVEFFKLTQTLISCKVKFYQIIDF